MARSHPPRTSPEANAARSRDVAGPVSAADPLRVDASEPADGQLEPSRCPNSIAWLVLLLIAGHLAAILAEPVRFFSQSESQVAPYAATWRATLAPYVEWLYLDHGYFFFAPNPGPSHLVGIRVEPPTDSMRAEPLRSGVPVELSRDVDAFFPNRQMQRPRLLYHRYFMLSEFYNSSFAPFELPEEDRSDLLFVDRWKQDRQFYTQLTNSIAHAWARRLKADSVDLVRLERALPYPDRVLRDGWRLDDPRGLERLPESLSADLDSGRSRLPRAPLGPWRPRPDENEGRSSSSVYPPGEVIRP